MSYRFSGRALLVALLISLTSLASAYAADDTLGIVTGPKTGTYYAFGKDIATAAAKAGIRVDVKASEGSIDNIKRLNGNENLALGIVQSDVLGFLSRSKNPNSIKMASSLRLIFPLYNEEVHILARHNIHNFTDLQGKKVVIGEDGSGDMLTAANLFSMMNVEPFQTIKESPAQGVVDVLKGEADAIIYVAGKPVRLFKNLEDLTLPENHKYASMLDDVHFLPLDDPKMLEEYKPAEITNADYSFVPDTVHTIAMQAVLVSYDFSHDNKNRCEKIGELATALRKSLPELKKEGHPKWKEAHLGDDTGIWKKDSCVWPGSKEETPADKNAVNQDLIRIIDRNKGN